MLPFTTEQFFDVFARYNAAVWPAPIIAYALGTIAIIAVLIGNRASEAVTAAVLSLLWA